MRQLIEESAEMGFSLQDLIPVAKRILLGIEGKGKKCVASFWVTGPADSAPGTPRVDIATNDKNNWDWEDLFFSVSFRTTEDAKKFVADFNARRGKGYSIDGLRLVGPGISRPIVYIQDPMEL